MKKGRATGVRMRYAIANFIENSGLTENGIQGTELYFRKE
jgi:hypothetical protein